MSHYWYLATPYSRYPEGPEAAFRAACWQAGVLMQAGVPVFSPIAHSHPIAAECGIDPLDLDLWLRVDRPMMSRARGLIVVRLPTWETSKGVEHEIAFFRGEARPVFYMDPGIVPLVFRTSPKQVAYERSRRGES